MNKKYKIEPEPNSIIIVDWTPTSASYTSWESIGEIYGCSTWTPDESTIVIGQTFNQERTCNVNQERFRQDRELSSKGTYKDIGNPQLETRSETVNQSRNNTGIMESWVSIGSLYGEWINNGSLYDCTNWTPDSSTINSGVSFQQEATDCKQDQNRTKQDREQETTTLAIRNIGLETNENQTLTNQSTTRLATGTKITEICSYNTITGSERYVSLIGNNFFYWDGVMVGYSAGNLIKDGYEYRRSIYKEKYVSQYFTDDRYEICRKSL